MVWVWWGGGWGACVEEKQPLCVPGGGVCGTPVREVGSVGLLRCLGRLCEGVNELGVQVVWCGGGVCRQSEWLLWGAGSVGEAGGGGGAWRRGQGWGGMGPKGAGGCGGGGCGGRGGIGRGRVRGSGVATDGKLGDGGG